MIMIGEEVMIWEIVIVYLKVISWHSLGRD
jgi:hypothetical protein